MLNYIHSLHFVICKPTFLIIIVFICNYNILWCYDLESFSNRYIKNTEYFVILNTGEIIIGSIIKINLINSYKQDNVLNKIPYANINKNINKNSTDNETNYILLSSIFGEIIIYEDEIIDINERENKNNYITPQKHSLFIMPTANPISNNHFIGNYELLLFMAGVGITDWVSIFGGRTILPFTLSNQQISLLNTKISFPIIGEKDKSSIAIATGANMVWFNSANKLFHIFAIATYNSVEMNNSTFTAGIFYKAGYQEFPTTAVLIDRLFYFNYPDGTFGLCAGIERPFNNRQDLSLILEIWNSDVGNAANTAILCGIRKNSRNLYADIGIAFGTHPFVMPFVSFVWMPFNK